jgi:hypothetical protein
MEVNPIVTASSKVIITVVIFPGSDVTLIQGHTHQIPLICSGIELYESCFFWTEMQVNLTGC